MQLRRGTALLFSPRRLQACRSLFRHPWQSLLGLAFLNRKPFPLTLRTGQTLAFSRRGRDHLFWDWYLPGGADHIEFTAEGEIQLEFQGQRLLLRPGTTDFFVFREIYLKDEYGLKNLPATLNTVVDLGGNIGLFHLRHPAPGSARHHGRTGPGQLSASGQEHHPQRRQSRRPAALRRHRQFGGGSHHAHLGPQYRRKFAVRRLGGEGRHCRPGIGADHQPGRSAGPDR